MARSINTASFYVGKIIVCSDVFPLNFPLSIFLDLTIIEKEAAKITSHQNFHSCDKSSYFLRICKASLKPSSGKLAMHWRAAGHEETEKEIKELILLTSEECPYQLGAKSRNHRKMGFREHLKRRLLWMVSAKERAGKSNVLRAFQHRSHSVVMSHGIILICST